LRAPYFVPTTDKLKSSSSNRHAANGRTRLGDYSFSFYLVKSAIAWTPSKPVLAQLEGGKQAQSNVERRVKSLSSCSRQVKPNVNLTVGWQTGANIPTLAYVPWDSQAWPPWPVPVGRMDAGEHPKEQIDAGRRCSKHHRPWPRQAQLAGRLVSGCAALLPAQEVTISWRRMECWAREMAGGVRTASDRSLRTLASGSGHVGSDANWQWLDLMAECGCLWRFHRVIFPFCPCSFVLPFSFLAELIGVIASSNSVQARSRAAWSTYGVWTSPLEDTAILLEDLTAGRFLDLLLLFFLCSGSEG
jgi:hypothetical protein